MMFQLYVQSSMWLAETGFGFKMLFIPGAGSVWYDSPSLSLCWTPAVSPSSQLA